MTELSPALEEDLRPQMAVKSTAGEQFECGIRKPRHARRRRLIKLQRDKGSSSPGLGVQEAAEPSTTTSPSESSDSSFSTGSSSENLQELGEGEKEEGGGEVVVTCVAHGMSSVMGRRREMEDAVRVELEFVKAEAEAEAVGSRRFDYFGVFDGHGGAQVAEACRDRMHRILQKVISEEEVIDWERVMGRCFEKMDFEISGPRDDSVPVAVVEEKTVGSTAVVAVVGSEEVVVANCGDSRAVICRNGKAVPLTVDHKPDREDELARIEAAGGKVINWNGYRVLGVLATSRSIGDLYLKPFVIAKPEVTVCSRTNDDEFIILGSDGLWDVVSNEVACQVTRRCLEGRIRRDQAEGGGANRALRAASLLVELAIARGSRDNISAVVVQLKRNLKRQVT